MIEKQMTRRASQVKITFVLPQDLADGPVVVLGDFNNWGGGGLLLRRRGATLKASVTLEAGRSYAFRYRRSSGDWFNDLSADGYQPNEYGGYDCVIDLTEMWVDTLGVTAATVPSASMRATVSTAHYNRAGHRDVRCSELR